MSSFLDGLNQAQCQAVEATEGPLLVIAGAGSGKTRVLTTRIAYLIREKGVRPDQILAVTFTNKAAKEMKERISLLLAQQEMTNDKFQMTNPSQEPEEGGGSFDIRHSTFDVPTALPLVGTFHSVCVRLLRRDIHHIGYENSFTIYDSADSEALMKKIIRSQDLDEKRFAPRAVLSSISRAKNLLIDEDRFPLSVESYFEDTVARLYPLYQKELKKSQALDFDDLIMKTVQVWQKFPDILERYQDRFLYLSVDEYQDTNYAQYMLTKLLAEKYRNLCVIGDDWQSIYSWRGADMTNILNFQKDYPEAKTVKLEQNYRSTSIIVEAANSVIKKNKHRTDKTLWTEKVSDEKIEIHETESERAESEQVIRIIMEEMKRSRQTSRTKDRNVNTEYRIENIGRNDKQGAKGMPPNSEFRIPNSSLKFSDFTILYRTNAQSRIIEEAFLRWGIPHRIVGGVGFYERKEIKDVLSYMRAISNPADSVSLLRIINTPSRKIGASTLETLGNYAAKYDLTLLEAIHRSSEILELNAGTKTRLMGFYKMLEDFREKKSEFPAAALMKYVLSITEFRAFLQDGTEEGEQRWGNVQELVTVASKYDELEPGISLATFLEEVALVSQTDKLSESEEGVTLMTLHNAKGLEFPYVFICGLEEGVLPHSQSAWTDNELEEERRLMYVGITRAREKLYLLHATSRQFYGNTNYNAPSRFLAEIPDQFTIRPGSAPSPFGAGGRGMEEGGMTGGEDASRAARFHDGDAVTHKSWGEGVIVNVRGDIATIAFRDPQVGIKKLAVNIAPIEKAAP